MGGARSDLCSLQDEIGEIVPSSQRHPIKAFLAHMSADETSWISNAKSAHCPNVLVSLIINSAWNQAVSDVRLDMVRSRDFDAFGQTEMQELLRDSRSVAGDADQVHGAEGAQHLDVIFHGAADSRNKKPSQSGFDVLLIGFNSILQTVNELIAEEVERVDFRVEGVEGAMIGQE